MRYFNENGEILISSWIKTGVFTLIGLIMLFNLPLSIINAGSRGVVLQLGKVVRIMGEGINFKTPFIEQVVSIDVKTQKHEAKANSASSDLQTVQATVAVNYSLNPSTVGDIYKTIGKDFEKVVIDPAIQEAIKASTARFTAEELITKREAIREIMEQHITDRLSKRGFVIEAVNIVNFEFSESFDKAIEAKVVAEQNALASKNKLEQTKYEAEQRIAQAKGEAEAIKIQSEAIQSQGGENYVQLQAIQKWQGQVPQYMMGNSVPFINLK